MAPRTVVPSAVADSLTTDVAERQVTAWIVLRAGTQDPMTLTALSVLAAAALGGAVAVGVTVLIITAVAVLALLGVINGLRTLGEITRFRET